MIHALKPSDQVARTNFAVGMLERTDASPDYLHQVCFSDEATFHANGVVTGTTAGFGSAKIHISHVSWREGAPSERVDQLNARQADWTLFFFSEKAVTGRSYLDMLELYALPQLPPQTPSNKMGSRHISATMSGITWPERWLRAGSAEVDQFLGLLGRHI
jgi:hypothetical protein